MTEKVFVPYSDCTVASGDCFQEGKCLRKCRPGAIPADQRESLKDRQSYTDAELYRLVVARNLLDGYTASKSQFDAMVRQLGDLEAADDLIAFREKRPGCIALENGSGYSCSCGVKWRHEDESPPSCRFDKLG